MNDSLWSRFPNKALQTGHCIGSVGLFLAFHTAYPFTDAAWLR